MRKDDAIRLRHMVDAAEEAISFASDRKREDLDLDRMLALSLVIEFEAVFCGLLRGHPFKPKG
jgi:hypothetical protein